MGKVTRVSGARIHLDLEEWQALYEAAADVPKERRRPCLQTALLGIGAALGAPRVMHDCESNECPQAHAAALQAIAAGEDPFMLEMDGDEHVPSVLVDVLDRLAALETEVFGDKP
jgi:hypothetical protein